MSGRNTDKQPRVKRPGAGPPGMEEKAKDFKGTWKKLVSYCKKYVPAIVVSLVLAAAGTVLTIIGPDQIGKMTNEIQKVIMSIMVSGQMIDVDFDAISKIAVLLIILYSTSAVLGFSQGYIMATVTQKIGKNMRTGISQKINKLPLKYFDKATFGDILSRVTNDVDTIGQSMNQSLGSMVTSVTMFFGAAIMMFYNNWLMALTAIGASIIGFAFISLVMGKSQKYFSRQQQDLGGSTDILKKSIPAIM